MWLLICSKHAIYDENCDMCKTGSIDMEKYKLKLEAAIYESCGKLYIGGKVLEQVLNEYHADQLKSKSVCLHCKSKIKKA